MEISRFLNNCLNDEWILTYLINTSVIFIPNCPNCLAPMSSYQRKESFYVCTKRRYGKKCNYSASIFKNTLFWKSRLSFHDLFYSLNAWRLNVTASFIAIDLNKNKSSITRLFQNFEKLTLWYINLNGRQRIGGPDCVVEIDECLLVKRKYRRGRILRGQKWIVGGVVRGDTSKYFVVFVPNRSRSQLLRVIQENVAPHSTIVTDEWKGYTNLEHFFPNSNYTHKTINHSLFFVHPLTGENTQSIEGFWSKLKRVLRKKGTNIGEIDKRINMFHIEIFKHRERKYLIRKMLEIMKEYMLFG